MRLPIFLQLVILTLIPVLATAQYRIHSWESFEEGIPQNLTFGHYADETTIFPFSYNSQSAPSEMRSPLASQVLGRAGVLFRPVPDDKPHLSLFSPVSLDRGALGEAGRALYQADVFLPAEGTPIPNISLLAQVIDSDGRAGYSFYRFGILGTGNHLFFSFTDNAAEPSIYHQQPISDFELKRPGWHRIQIIFLGQDQIFCAINTRMTEFSPISESTHRRLNAGLMVTANPQGQPAAAVLDNLSIQWTPMEVPLPDSPWIAQDPRIAETPLDEGLLWETNPSAAWRVANTQNRPLLVMFYAPRINPFQHLLSIYPNDDEARDLLSKYVLLKVDANQLAGGALAERFNIFRLPTMLLMAPDGKETDRIEVISGRTIWEDIAAQLE